MKLERIVKEYSNKKEEILAQIEKLTEESCVEAFLDYLDNPNGSDISDYEKGYITALNRNLMDFGTAVSREESKSVKTLEEAIELIVEMRVEGTYCFESMLDNAELMSFMESSLISKGKMLEIIIQYMKDTLEEYSKNKMKTKTQKEEENRQKRIAELKRNFEYYKKELEKIV